MKLSQFVGQNPFDKATWPDKITAKIVEPGVHPKIHGYDLHHDLARYYRWSETIYLSLTGELPEEKWLPAIDIAFLFLSSVTVAEAPGHAAVLAGFCGVINSASIGIVSLALAEQGRSFVQEFFALEKSPPIPTDDRGIIALRERLQERQLYIPVETRLGVGGAALSVLVHCGLTSAIQLESAWVIAKLPVALAESWQQPASQFTKYPTQLPQFHYQHPRQQEES